MPKDPVLPEQDLTCPDPQRCPAIDRVRLPDRLPTVALEAGRHLFRVYDGTWGYDEPNPGYGDARFSPFDATGDGHRVPSLYLAESPVAALLESVFHDVHTVGARLVYERDLGRQLLTHVRTPAPLRLADLRDPILRSAGIDRASLVSSPSEHYPCTRRIARHIHGAAPPGGPVQGMVWHSRQAGLHEAAPMLSLVVFADRYAAGRGGWVRTGPGSQNLLEGPGRLLVEEIALALDATIVT